MAWNSIHAGAGIKLNLLTATSTPAIFNKSLQRSQEDFGLFLSMPVKPIIQFGFHPFNGTLFHCMFSFTQVLCVNKSTLVWLYEKCTAEDVWVCVHAIRTLSRRWNEMSAFIPEYSPMCFTVKHASHLARHPTFDSREFSFHRKVSELGVVSAQ